MDRYDSCRSKTIQSKTRKNDKTMGLRNKNSKSYKSKTGNVSSNAIHQDTMCYIISVATFAATVLISFNHPALPSWRILFQRSDKHILLRDYISVTIPFFVLCTIGYDKQQMITEIIRFRKRVKSCLDNVFSTLNGCYVNGFINTFWVNIHRHSTFLLTNFVLIQMDE